MPRTTVAVDTAGAVALVAGSVSGLSLDGLRFRAEQ